ncbi:hypothetical protein J2Z57_003573 [Formosa algae]|uniref:Uncharacterized protein n=1 Tax=Formosa algae TaxID=225843 RepID=A0A9X0YRK1_9FLAO|nr:hypothetical protein [Formosa algae]MDQ0337111.1 hypothetical protein [Formosa algae]
MSLYKLIAFFTVCNPLLKHPFAIAKSGSIYDDSHRNTLVKN